jgi:hypothetical protein
MSPLPVLAERFHHADLDGRPRPGPGTIPNPGGRGVPGTNPAERATSALRKAWLGDDAGDVEQARAERAEAAWFVRMAIRDGTPLNRNLSVDLALLADLLRRSGDYQGAIAAARRGLSTTVWGSTAEGGEGVAGPPEGVGSLLLYQLQLALAGDEGRHHIGEALAGA